MMNHCEHRAVAAAVVTALIRRSVKKVAQLQQTGNWEYPVVR
jgi:hypothetical protein